MTYINEIRESSSTKLLNEEKSTSLIDLIVSLIRRIFGSSIEGPTKRLNLALAANPKMEEKPKITGVKDSVWKIMTAEYKTNPHAWQTECIARVRTAHQIIESVVRKNPDLQRDLWFTKEYLQYLPCLYSSFSEFKKNVKPSLSNYA